VLGFPFIFRGALDVHATAINEEMKLAATRALAALAKEDVPDSVCRAYGVSQIKFGRDSIVPRVFDPRVLLWEASAVAEAAMQTGVAQEPVDLDEYREQLEKRLGKAREVMLQVTHRAQAAPKRVVFPEGENEKILRACHVLVEEKVARPILLGNEHTVRAKAQDLGISLDGMQVVDVEESDRQEAYVQEYYQLRQRRGVTLSEARELIKNRNVFGSLMVHMGEADALVSGVSQHYPDTLRPALQVIKVREDVHRVSGLYAVLTRKGDLLFLADCSVNIEPTAEQLAEIALCAAEVARRFQVEPRVAMLSFSNFGSTEHPLAEKVRRATRLVKERDPLLMVDGEMMGDTAVTPEILEQEYPFSTLQGAANVLIFPDLQSASIACKLLIRVGGAEPIGPILMGMSRPVYVLHRGADADDIVNIATIAVVDAQENHVPAHAVESERATVAAD
ncbi:MAG TPA: phosphate acyltransferase, partial [Candidatus Acidoferrales bacterium]|nr:phosphate acyltransferase [Candidatus Acidoferrales bacterium]